MGTLKPQSSGPLYSNTLIDTLAVDGWAVPFGTARTGLGGLRPSPFLAVPNVTAHPSTASVPTSLFDVALPLHSKGLSVILVIISPLSRRLSRFC